MSRAAAYPSPLSESDITDPNIRIAFGLPSDADGISRREAMRVPAVRRARAIVCGTIAGLTWQARRGYAVVERELLAQPDPTTTPQYLWAWTVDDLLFNGLSWWRVTARDDTGYPTHVERIERGRVSVAIDDDPWRAGPAEYVVYVDGRRQPDADMIRIDGPDEGVLEYGATTLRTAMMLERAVRKFARLDVPLGYLRPAEGAQELSLSAGSAGDGTERSEVDALLDEWESARETRTTAFLNRAVEYTAVMFDAQRVQLAEARQYQAAEIARLMNLPPRYVNAPQASGMTYATTEGDRRDLLDTTLSQYVVAISQRLSMGDVTPRGQLVTPDLNAWLRGNTRDVLEAGEIAVRTGAMTGEEVRTDWLKLPARGAADQPSELE